MGGEIILILLIGTNGTGKSSFPKSLFSDKTEYIKENGKIIATIFPEYNFCAVGKYKQSPNKVGGADNYNSLDEIFYSLDYILKNYQELDIIMEGIFFSTLKTRPQNKIKEIKQKYDKITVIMYLTCPIEQCINRVINRNGKKPKTKHLLLKHKSARNQYKNYKKEGIITIPIDTSKLQLEQYKPILLKIKNKYKPLEMKQLQ